MSWILLLILWDLQNLLARFRRPVELDQWLPPSTDFTVVVPVYGEPRYLDNLDYLESIKENVLLALEVSNEKMASFADQLESDAWRVFRTRCTTSPVGVPELILRALMSGCVPTTYVVRLDGDSYSKQDVRIAIAAIARADADVCSMKVRVASPRHIIECLQAVEYDMSMLSRHFRPWLTSGACMVAKTAVLRHVLEYHSRWFPGEDMETGRIAKHFGFRIIHCNWEVFTVAPSNWRSWYRQRRSWWSGNFRHAIQNFDINARYAPWMLYYGVLVWGLLAGKLLSLRYEWEDIPLLICAYTLVTLAANWQVRNRWMLGFPYYALFQVLVMPPVGALYYLLLCIRRRRLGRYLIGYRTQRVHQLSLDAAEALAAGDYEFALSAYERLRDPAAAVVRARIAERALARTDRGAYVPAEVRTIPAATAS